jgi:hypothetical protein
MFLWPPLFSRFFKYELLPKNAILKEDLPFFLSTSLDRSNSSCMFTAAQQRTWTTSHLASGAWYLDCATHYTPLFEMELRKSREAIGESGEEMEELKGIQDDNGRAKALKRRIEEDRKKALKVKEAEEKAHLKELERQEKTAAKSTKKYKKKVTTPVEVKMITPVQPSPTVDSGSQIRSVSARGTKRDISYETLSQLPVVDLTEETNCMNDEFILNSSLFEILGGESGSLSPLYDDLKAFMSKVFLFSCVKCEVSLNLMLVIM